MEGDELVAADAVVFAALDPVEGNWNAHDIGQDMTPTIKTATVTRRVIFLLLLSMLVMSIIVDKVKMQSGAFGEAGERRGNNRSV